jgi:hypothetical protein
MRDVEHAYVLVEILIIYLVLSPNELSGQSDNFSLENAPRAQYKSKCSPRRREIPNQLTDFTKVKNET